MLVLDDFVYIFNKHAEQVYKGHDDGMIWTHKFYKDNIYDQKTYNRLLENYNFHVDLVQDLMLELTRAANNICDQVRIFIMPNYRLKEGALLVTYGPIGWTLSFKTIRVEYTDKEKQFKLYPYPAIEEFKCIRTSRDHSFGSGSSIE